MRFARQARILRGPLDATPVAGVLFLLALFILLGSLLTTPGTLLQVSQLNLPEGKATGQMADPALVLAVDNRGQYFLENTPVSEGELKSKLREAVQHTQRLTLIVRADRTVEMQTFTHLCEIAAQAGVTETLLAERPLSPAPARK